MLNIIIDRVLKIKIGPGVVYTKYFEVRRRPESWTFF